MVLVSIAHFFSHFYLLLLPPLFPVLSASLGIGYTQLGFALTAFSLLSGFTQAPIGFAVDRFGARQILILGMIVEGVAFALMGFTASFVTFVVLLGIAGVANSVYHPADYAILNHVVPASRIGRAFSFHTSAGLLGEAVAPASVLLLSAIIDWRIALALCGLAGVIVAVVMIGNSHVLAASDETGQSPPSDKDQPQRQRSGMGLLFTAPIIMGLLFFACISIVSRGVTGFSVSALHLEHGYTLMLAGTVLSAWLFAAPIGVLVGGFVADRTTHHAGFAALCFIIMAACLLCLALVSVPFVVSVVLFAIGGFFSGAVSPSRDMIIRSVTPPGQSGKVFGFVSTGFNVGGIIAPPMYGYLLDNTSPDAVFIVAAMASLLTMTTVIGTGLARRQRAVSAGTHDANQ